MSYETRLKTMDRAYSEISDEPRVAMLGLGKHEVEIVGSEIVETDWSGDLQWRIQFKNDEGERTEHLNLERESTLFKVKQLAPRLGYDGPLSGLPQWAPVAVGAKVFIEIVEKPNKNNPEKPYINVNVVKLLSEGKGQPLKEAPSGPAPDFDDSIPFQPTV